MERNTKLLETPSERILLGRLPRRQAGGFLAFLICVALMVTAFAFSGVWIARSQKEVPSYPEETEGIDSTSPPSTQAPSSTEEQAPTKIPLGAIHIADFHDPSAGALRNETAYKPNVEQLKAREEAHSFDSSAPAVLILHTHASEAYLNGDVTYLEGKVGDLIYSDRKEDTVVAVGKVFCEALNECGIPAIQCEESHGEEGTLRNSYSHAAECVQSYLEKYPSIQYVIDLHRDGILNSEGELVRTESGIENIPAQVMAIVGTDGNGTDCPEWENNLSLALRLFTRLESSYQGICRSVQLRKSSYNQELAKRMLLLEIGSAGNTVGEACSTARVVAASLAELLKHG